MSYLSSWQRDQTLYRHMRDEVNKIEFTHTKALDIHYNLRTLDTLGIKDITRLDALMRCFNDISFYRGRFLAIMDLLDQTHKTREVTEVIARYKKVCDLSDALVFRSSVAFSKEGRVLNPLCPSKKKKKQSAHLAVAMGKPSDVDTDALHTMEKCYLDVKRDARLVYDLLTCSGARSRMEDVGNIMKRMDNTICLFSQLERGLAPGNRPETVALVSAKFKWSNDVYEKLRAFMQNPTQRIQ